SRRNIVALDSIYWLLICMPATWLLNVWVGSGDSDMATYYALRNGANGIGNALVAYLAIQLPILLGGAAHNRQKISLRQALFAVLVAAALMPTLALTASGIRHQQGVIEANISRELRFLSEEMMRELEAHPDPKEMAEVLKLHDRHGETPLTVLDRAGRVVAASRGDLAPGQVYGHESGVRLDAGSPLDDVNQAPRIIAAAAVYREGFNYERVTALPGNGGLTLLVEIPAEPYQKAMQEVFFSSIRSVLGFSVLIFFLGRLVSYKLTDSLVRLAEASTNLKWKVLEGESVPLPVSPIIEINTLVANFGDMAIGLGKSFRELSHSHEALERGINERTHELHEINRQLEAEIAERKQFEEKLAERALTLEKTMVELESQKFALDQHAIVAITDPAGKIVYANDKFCEISQYSREELLGQNPRIMNSGYHPQSFFAELWATVERGEVWRGEVRNRKKDGSFYWLATTIVPFLGHSGKPYQYVVIRTDITASKESAESLVKLNRTLKMLNSCDEALVRIRDEDDLLHEICRICVETGGYRTAWVGFAMEDAAKSVRPAAMAGSDLACLDKAAISWDVDAERGSGPVGAAIRASQYCLVQDVSSDPATLPWRDEALACGYAAVIALPLFLDDGQVGVLTVYSAASNGFGSDEINLLRDLAANLAYGIKSLRLAAENKRAGQELLLAKEEAERANRAKSEFLSRMSHELRTPLNAILGFAQLMEHDPVEPLSPSQSASVKHIIQAGWHQLALVNEVLDLARIEAGRMQMHLERVMLAQAVQECIDLVSPLSSERQLKVEDHVSACGECFVWADLTRFKQVMLNLLSNAIKYNREGGTITLACQRSAPGRQKVSVTDTGHGIPADRLDELFVPFNRLDADKSHTQGTGVGLAVAKRLVELMGGEIGVESRLGEGSTFWIELPEHGKDSSE
ncbi:MAG: ATP-binding protein, partial [Sulfuricella sp.]|nr:ATP-binding protein [Sulfuricella sp.]